MGTGKVQSKPATGHQPDLKYISLQIARSVATFLYVPNTRRAISTRAALLVSSCRLLSLFVSNCRQLCQLSRLSLCFCGFLWPFVASRGLLWPFEAFCGIESHPRSLSRLSPIAPICPRLSQSVPFSPGNNFFQFGSAAIHKILSYFFLLRGSLVSEEFLCLRTRKESTALFPAIRWRLVQNSRLVRLW